MYYYICWIAAVIFLLMAMQPHAIALALTIAAVFWLIYLTLKGERRE